MEKYGIGFFLKIILGIVLGLLFSFLTIVCMDVVLPNPNPFSKGGLNLWLVGPIVAAWLFLILWLLLRKRPSAKFETRGIDQLPVSASELIDAVIEAMRYRKSIRAEVHQELADHFTDALADCETNEERQKRAKELIAEFGDVELLGKLIRRGKKRCRPLWRTMVVRAFQCAAALLIVLVLYIGWFLTGKPVISTNYIEVMNRQVQPVADESLNAKPFYLDAISHYVQPGTIKPEVTPDLPPELQGGPDSEFDTSPRPYRKLSPQEQKVLAEWIAANQQTADLVRQGNQKPYYWQTYSTNSNSTEVLAVMLPHLKEFKQLSHLLCMKAIWQAQQGQLKDSFENAMDSYHFGMHLRNKNILIEALVAIAIEANSTKTMRLLLADYSDKMDGSMLSAVRKELASIVDSENFTLGFEGEKLFLYDEVQRCFTQSRFGKSHIYIQRLREVDNVEMLDVPSPQELGQLFHILFTHPDRDATLDQAKRFYAAMDEFVEYSPAQLRQKGIDVNKRFEELIQGNLLMELMFPALEQLIHRSYQSKADSQAMLTILAILEYQKQNKTLPETLNTLVETGFLKAVPMDPYSDQALVYKMIDGGFTLYSVGPNFRDDGGVPGTHGQGSQSLWAQDRTEEDQMISGGDAVFWPVE